MMVALRTIYHTTNLMVMVKDIEHAIKEMRDCIDYYNIPSSEWNGGQVFDENNDMIGKITYNGKWIPLPHYTMRIASQNR